MQMDGLHHVTAVSGKIQENHNFYTQVLGLRLVKKSVNQDDVSAYHLFYADQAGTPGTDITFFDWPHIQTHQPGTDSIQGTAFRVSSQDSLDYWTERLQDQGGQEIHSGSYANLDLLSFQDPEGQQLYLVNDQGAPFQGEPWTRPDIPDRHLLKGFYSVILSTPALHQLDELFQTGLNFQKAETGTWIDGETTAVRYQTTAKGGPGTEIWLLDEPGKARAQLGAGGVHHVAFRVRDRRVQEKWRKKLASSGLHATQIIDRHWFHSIYFRVARGILFEIATEGPGFTVDEDLNQLGETLILPPFLESQREEIKKGLSPIST